MPYSLEMLLLCPISTPIKSFASPYKETGTAPNFSAITTTTNKTSARIPQRTATLPNVRGCINSSPQKLPGEFAAPTLLLHPQSWARAG